MKLYEKSYFYPCDAEVCAIFAKVLFHNITGIVRKELNQYLEEDDTGKPHNHTYVANIVQLAKMFREYGLQRYIRSGNRNAINSRRAAYHLFCSHEKDHHMMILIYILQPFPCQTMIIHHP